MTYWERKKYEPGLHLTAFITSWSHTEIDSFNHTAQSGKALKES